MRAAQRAPAECGAESQGLSSGDPLQHLAADSTRKEPYMRHSRLIVGALLFMACAPGRVYMNDVNTTPAIAEADRLIADAQRAGADSLATQAITTARLALESARAFDQGGRRGRAQVEALRA